jgi:hypothetical protein
VSPDAQPTAGASRDFLKALPVLGLDENERCNALRHLQRFARGVQHDHQGAAWDGAPRDPGVGYLHERLRPQGYVPVSSAQIPLNSRCPDTPVPLGRQIVSRFTEMICSEGRRPVIMAAGDDVSAYFAAFFDAARLWPTLEQARDLAGGQGVAAVVVSAINGRLQSEVLDPADLWVAEWDTEWTGWRPRVVVEQKLVCVDELDKESGRLRQQTYWTQRVWTDKETIVFNRLPVKDAAEAKFVVAPNGRIPHKLGRCPVVWYQNTRNTASPDGLSDLDGAHRLMDKADRLQSQVYKAVLTNADPSLLFKETAAQLRRTTTIQRGSGGAIKVSPEGDARYLELQGTSIEVGYKGIDRLVQQILDTTECVIVTPETIRAYTSGEALQIAWRAMETSANRKRQQFGELVIECADLARRFGQAYGVKEKGGLRIAPKVTPAPKGSKQPPKTTPHVIPKGEPELSLDWPPYWMPTPAQIQSMAAAMSTAVGGKPVLSVATATKTLAQFLGEDPIAESDRVTEEAEEAEEKLLEQMEMELGAKETKPEGGAGEKMSEDAAADEDDEDEPEE